MNIGSGLHAKCDARLRRRDGDFDGGLRDEVRDRRRLRDDLDRIGAALEAGAGVAVTLPCCRWSRSSPAGRGR